MGSKGKPRRTGPAGASTRRPTRTRRPRVAARPQARAESRAQTAAPPPAGQDEQGRSPQQAAERRPHRTRQRRSFSQRNLALETSGALGPLLGEALTVPADDSGYQLTHVFHAYPGRFHPRLPHTLLSAFFGPEGPLGSAATGERGRVLDPFMGGGTTLVEALRLGLAAGGNDLNPVALLVARERTRPRTVGEANRLEALARQIADDVAALRGQPNAPRLQHPAPQRLVPHYLPHLLAELMQWLRLIGTAPAGPLRESLRAVFSSAVVKFSNLASDSQAQSGTPPRYPKGAVSRFLVGKTAELAQAQVRLAAEQPPGTPPPVLTQEDARLLPSAPWGGYDLVLTSPPYPGTYDYHAQHRLRMDWLQLDDAPFDAGEIGARRHQDAGPGAPREGWSESLRAVLGTLARVLRPGGSLLVVMGDWIADSHAVDAAAMLERTAHSTDWTLADRASVQRDTHSRVEARAFARRGKWEHLLHFTRPATVLPETTEEAALPETAPPPTPAVVTTQARSTPPQDRPTAPRPSRGRRAKPPQWSPEERERRRQEKAARDYARTPRARRERAALGLPEPEDAAPRRPTRPSSRGVVRPGRPTPAPPPEPEPQAAVEPPPESSEPLAEFAPESPPASPPAAAAPAGTAERPAKTGRRIRTRAEPEHRRTRKPR